MHASHAFVVAAQGAVGTVFQKSQSGAAYVTLVAFGLASDSGVESITTNGRVLAE
jgi:hypothetical protein